MTTPNQLLSQYVTQSQQSSFFIDKMGIINVKSYGAVGDGVTDDTDALITAASEAETNNAILYIPKDMVCYVSGELNLFGVINIICNGTIKGASTSNELVIGYNSAQTTPTYYYLNDITDIKVKIQGIKNGNTVINRAPYVLLWADGDVSNKTSIAYSKFTFGKVDTLEFNSQGSDIGWINENSFYGGRIGTILMDGNYEHNNNRFHSLDLEGCSITLNKGQSNSFWNIRLEGTNTITFGSTTHSNVIIQSWNSLSRDISSAINATVTDNGTSNICLRLTQVLFDKISICNYTKDILNFDGVVELDGFSTDIVSGLKAMTSAAFKGLYTSDYIPVNKGMVFSFTSDASLWRPRIYIYDENKAAITATGNELSFSDKTQTSNYYTVTSNKSSVTNMCIVDDTVKFVKLMAYKYAAGSFEYFNWSVFLSKRFNSTNILSLCNKLSPLTLSASPTKGFAKVGQIVSKSDGTYIYICTKSIDITTAEEVAALETAVDVSDATGVENGDIVGLLLDNGGTHWTTVNGAPVANTITLTTGPASVSASGSRIVFNKWVAK